MTEEKNNLSHVRLTLKRSQDFALDVDITPAPSGVTVLFGPSGCGKTTILRSVAGLERAKGEVRIAGETWQDDSRKIFVPTWKRPLGYVFQGASLFPHMTADENIRFGLRYARGRGTTEERISEAVELLGLGKLLDHRPSELSGGEQQRVAMARARVLNPKLLLMDEPLSALDWERRAEIIPWIARIRDEQGLPILYVTHSADELAKLANEVVLIERGKVRASGPVEKMLPLVRSPLTLIEEPEFLVKGTVTERDEKYGLAKVELPGRAGSLWVQDEGLPEGSPVRVAVFERDVSLAVIPPEASSIQNSIPSVIESIEGASASQVRVTLRAGNQVLASRITRRSCDKLELKVGLPVFAQVKTAAIKL